MLMKYFPRTKPDYPGVVSLLSITGVLNVWQNSRGPDGEVMAIF